MKWINKRKGSSMNKQPFYHEAQLDLDATSANEKIIKDTVCKIPTVLKDTFEYFSDELFFTATSDVSALATLELQSKGVVFKYIVSAEPGDPTDLM
jgi:hypothetical protein